MVDKVIASGCTTLLSTNVGCSLQLRGELRQRGADVEIIHPLTLLSRQLA
jgi:glycolate oxidase iron-sulfur subunit